MLYNYICGLTSMCVSEPLHMYTLCIYSKDEEEHVCCAPYVLFSCHPPISFCPDASSLQQVRIIQKPKKRSGTTHICMFVLFIRLYELRAYYQSNYKTGYPSACHSCILYKQTPQSLLLCLLLSVRCTPSLFPFRQTLPFTSSSFLHSAVSVGILKILVHSLLLHPSIPSARSLAYAFINFLYKLNGFYKRYWEQNPGPKFTSCHDAFL